MERDTNQRNDPLQPDDIQLQARLAAYFNAKLGEPQQPDYVWNSIAARLGEQEGQVSVEFARSLDGLYDRPSDATHKNQAQTRELNGLPEGARKMRTKIQRERLMWGGLWNPAVAAAVILAVIGLLVVLLAISNKVPVNPATTPTPIPGMGEIPLENPGFEEGFIKWGANPTSDYSFGIDNSVVHSGNASMAIASKTEQLSTVRLTQRIDPGLIAGNRVRLSGYIRTRDVTALAGLSMQVFSVQEQGSLASPTSAYDDMSDRAPSGTTDWTRYEVVLDIPKEATDVWVGAVLKGGGQMWVDDLELVRVDDSVATTDSIGHQDARNMGFEDGTHWWELLGPYATKGIDNQTVHGGKTSARLEQTTSDPENYAAYAQWVRVGNYAGKRVRFSAFLKTDNVQEQAGLWLQVYNGLAIAVQDEMETRPIYGTTDWTQYEIVLDVPPNSTILAMGVQISGAGRLWIDDADLEIVGEDVPTTNIPVQEELTNAGFEDGLQPGWHLISARPTQFEVGTSSEQAYTGSQGAYLRVVAEQTDKTASLQQTLKADAYRNESVRITAYVNADKAKGDAYIWAQIYDPIQQANASSLSGESHAAAGQGGWQKREITLYVPTTAQTITLGAKLTGEGEVWLDDVQIVVIPHIVVTPTP